MLKNLSYVSIAFIYINLLGYIFHFYVSRHLSPEGYGEFMVLYSLMLTVGNFSGIFTVISIKTMSESENREAVLRYLRLFALIIGTIFMVAGVISSPFIKYFFKISYLPYIWIISLTWIFMFLVAAEKGYLQAKSHFGIFSFVNSFELTVRLLIAILLISSGCYIWGALFPSFFCLLSVFILLTIINKNFKGSIQKIPFKKLCKIAIYASPGGFFIYMDDIFIKRVFSPEMAGLYASASIIGKSLILFCMNLFSVFFPKLIENVSDNKIFKKLIIKILFLIIAIFLLAEIFVLLWGKAIFLILFGEKFVNAFKILPIYIIAILPLTLSIIFMWIKTVEERNIYLIYLHLILYFGGFTIFNFTDIMSYLLYIFSFNTIFSLVYIRTLFHTPKNLP